MRDGQEGGTCLMKIKLAMLAGLFWMATQLGQPTNAEGRSHVAQIPVQVAVTVDDLPSHGAIPLSTTRLAVSRKFLDVFKKYRLRACVST